MAVTVVCVPTGWLERRGSSGEMVEKGSLPETSLLASTGKLWLTVDPAGSSVFLSFLLSAWR